MNRDYFAGILRKLLERNIQFSVNGNYLSLADETSDAEQSQTNEAFSDKWSRYDKSSEKEGLYEMQKRWYLDLYGFNTEESLAVFLKGRKIIFDAGCGLGYKAAWFSELAPESLVIGMDFSDAARQAAHNYSHLPNLFFLRGDIAKKPLPGGQYRLC